MANSAKPSHNARREAARREAARMRQEAEAKQKRTRTITIVGVIALLLAVAVALWFIVHNNKGGDGGSSTPSSSAAVSSQIDAPGAVSIGASGKPGSVNEGKPVVEVYFDFLCPHCFVFEQNYLPALEKLAADGEVTLVMHAVAIMDRTEDHTGFSSLSADAYHEVAMRDPEHFSGLGVKLFELAHALSEGSKPVTGQGLDQIVETLREHGVNAEVVDDIAAGKDEKIAADSVQSFVDVGLKGTPALLVNGEELPIDQWGNSADELVAKIRETVK